MSLISWIKEKLNPRTVVPPPVTEKRLVYEVCSAKGCFGRADMVLATSEGDLPFCFSHYNEHLEKYGTPIKPRPSPDGDPGLDAQITKDIDDVLAKDLETEDLPEEELEPEPTGDPEVCYSDDCDNSEGIEAHEVRGGKFYLCEYHSKHPERLHFPKPKETDSGGA